jgi:simple sugar transport system ATP-binding protein
MHGICKRFGAVEANRDVDLTLDRGEIVALLGENGAGKTTLMNVLFGTYAADAGRIEIDGEPVSITDPAVAIAHGIGMVHQHFHVVPSLTVLENLMIGRKGRSGFLDVGGARRHLAEVGERFGLSLDPDARVGDLAIGQQQRLEILKALLWGARILILDEPTAVLTPQESEALFRALRAMAGDGLGIVFISHKLKEVRALTTRIVVLRQGRVVAALSTAEVESERQLAELMCGHELVPPTKPAVTPGEVLLKLEGVTTRLGNVRLHDIGLELRSGEILGVAGVSGNGQRELADVLAGVLPVESGTIVVAGQRIDRAHPRLMQGLGVGRVPEDRMGTGLITGMSLADNLAMTRVREPPFSRLGILDPPAMRRFAAAQIERFRIDAPGPGARAAMLSGGNLQKTLLARELAGEPLVLLAAQPTRGLDVGAAEFVHGRFLEMRSKGRGVLLISEDLEEILALSDRIAVMYEGRIVGVLERGEASVRQIGLMMAGAREAA